jgi:hypothetical protein
MGRADSYPLDKYLDASRTLSLDGFDWSRAAAEPLDPGIERVMVYMLRIEAQTLFYVRDLLNTRTAFVPEIGAFLAVWLYEEERHSRIFKRFLRERGVVLPDDDRTRVRRASVRGMREVVEAKLAQLCAMTTEHFIAVHMAYGAANELSTIHAYERLAERCDHSFLRELCASIAKDERRHFAFYYNQAARFLQREAAQKLTRFILRHWWKPVGYGIHSPQHATFMVDWFFGDTEGLRIMQDMDATLDKLPGLQGLGLFERFHVDAKRYIEKRSAEGQGFDDWVPMPSKRASVHA